MEDKFFEADYFREFKKVRNRFRKYDSVGLIEHAFNFLYREPKKPFDDLKKQPWNVLLLIKWILIDREAFTPKKKIPTQNDFINILQMVRDLGGEVRLPNINDDLRLFMRLLAFQQFHYQRSLNLVAFSRQFILFDDLPENHLFKKNFFNETGLEISEFLQLSIIFLVSFSKRIKPIEIGWFSKFFSDELTREKFETFLNLISLELKEAQKFAKSKTVVRHKSSEYYEQTIFINHPFLEVKDKFYPYHLMLLYRGLECFIYDKLREVDSSFFMSKFGDTFEKYVDQLISYSGSDFESEKSLIKVLPPKSKVVDFLVKEGNKNILIDAKAIEMQYQGRVNSDPRIVKRAVKSSIVKGVDQAYEMIESLVNIKGYESTKKASNNFLLIVSYKELFLGNGIDFEKSIGKTTIKNIREKYGEQLKIPLKNIYFISIDSLEYWTESLKNGSMNFSDGIRKASIDDSDGRTSKFDFMQHITSWDIEIEIPVFLRERLELTARKIFIQNQ